MKCTRESVSGQAQSSGGTVALVDRHAKGVVELAAEEDQKWEPGKREDAQVSDVLATHGFGEFVVDDLVDGVRAAFQ